MTDTPSPAEVVERLEARARHADVRKAGAEFNGMAFMAAEEVETARDLRAAASLIRELTELLAPMAACGKRIPEHAWDDDWYTLDGQDEDGKPFDKAEQKFLCSDLRRAAKLVEPQ